MLVLYESLLVDDYICESTNECLVALFVAVINASFHAVITRNNFDRLVDLLKKLQMSFVMNLKVDECYYLNNFEKA